MYKYPLQYGQEYADVQRWVFKAALNDSNESLEVTETGNAFQTVTAAWTKVGLQSPAPEWDLLASDKTSHRI